MDYSLPKTWLNAIEKLDCNIRGDIDDIQKAALNGF